LESIRDRVSQGATIPVNNVDINYSDTTIKEGKEKGRRKNEKLETRRVGRNEGETERMMRCL
jgi:hypothetical protein